VEAAAAYAVAKAEHSTQGCLEAIPQEVGATLERPIGIPCKA